MQNSPQTSTHERALETHTNTLLKKKIKKNTEKRFKGGNCNNWNPPLLLTLLLPFACTFACCVSRTSALSLSVTLSPPSLFPPPPNCKASLKGPTCNVIRSLRIVVSPLKSSVSFCLRLLF